MPESLALELANLQEQLTHRMFAEDSTFEELLIITQRIRAIEDMLRSFNYPPLVLAGQN